jgi:hypothetical protein
MNAHRGWTWFDTKHKRAPNFGGEERWVEVTWVCGGERLVASGATVQQANAEAIRRINYRLDEPAPVVVNDPDMPF